MTNKTKSDPNLLKLKTALAAGGLLATLIGARLLSDESTDSSSAALNTGTTSAVSTRAEITSIDATMPDALDLDLSLEAIPTVVAPTVRSGPVAMSRSSG